MFAMPSQSTSDWFNKFQFVENRNFEFYGGIMDKKKYWIIRLFFVLFTMSVSVAILPCGIINVHGLFGEVTTYVVVEDKEQEIVSIKDVDNIKVQTVKGINILIFKCLF